MIIIKDIETIKYRTRERNHVTIFTNYLDNQIKMEDGRLLPRLSPDINKEHIRGSYLHWCKDFVGMTKKAKGKLGFDFPAAINDLQVALSMARYDLDRMRAVRKKIDALGFWERVKFIFSKKKRSALWPLLTDEMSEVLCIREDKDD